MRQEKTSPRGRRMQGTVTSWNQSQGKDGGKDEKPVSNVSEDDSGMRLKSLVYRSSLTAHLDEKSEGLISVHWRSNGRWFCWGRGIWMSFQSPEVKMVTDIGWWYCRGLSFWFIFVFANFLWLMCIILKMKNKMKKASFEKNLMSWCPQP